jgi:hypothetical protein
MWGVLIPLTAGVLAAGAWTWGRNAIRGTTLTGPWTWHLIAVLGLCVAATCLLSVGGKPDWAQAVRLAVATLLFCPTMALLGARRPQHGAWHFIVLTLWCVLILPAAEIVLLRPGQILEVRDFRGWFLWVLIAAELLNRLGTRLWLAGLLQASTEILLLAEFLPLLRQPFTPVFWLVAPLLWALALAEMARVYRASRAEEDVLSRQWLQFRDRFGVLWGLRIMERINAAAVMYNWPLRLHWSGFAGATDNLPAEADAGLRQTLANLLRRFEREE